MTYAENDRHAHYVSVVDGSRYGLLLGPVRRPDRGRTARRSRPEEGDRPQHVRALLRVRDLPRHPPPRPGTSGRTPEPSTPRRSDDPRELLTARAENGVTWRIVEGSAGSFLDPPGSARHSWEIWEGSLANPRGIMTIDTDDETMPDKIRAKVRELLDAATLVRSEVWEAEVYGYFKNCYSPDGVERRADRLLIVGMPEKLYPGHPRVESGEFTLNPRYESLNHAPVVSADDPRCTPEHHAAFLLVRTYFPDAEPRLDLIDSGGSYGTRKCGRCEATVQYDAKIDDYAVFGTHSSACQGFPTHDVARAPATEEVK